MDALVNCAGVMYYTLMKNVRAEERERTVEVNCKGALNCVGAVLPGMLERGRGHIVTVYSDAGRVVFPGLAVGSASKFFVEALSKGLRLETAGTGLKVTTVQPGNVATDLLELSGDEEALEHYGQPPGGKVLDPEDVARAVIYALSQPDHVAVNEVPRRTARRAGVECPRKGLRRRLWKGEETGWASFRRASCSPPTVPSRPTWRP